MIAAAAAALALAVQAAPSPDAARPEAQAASRLLGEAVRPWVPEEATHIFVAGDCGDAVSGYSVYWSGPRDRDVRYWEGTLPREDEDALIEAVQAVCAGLGYPFRGEDNIEFSWIEDPKGERLELGPFHATYHGDPFARVTERVEQYFGKPLRDYRGAKPRKRG